ncbi:MAG TPA: GIY-YIG nuclease family protein [Chthoniobacterales bacterium]|jgi:putative endonuclease|nr:GIY-YIG nuclease family protein [Chthoniobacterales bacterium]
MERTFYVYMMTNRSRVVLYTGVTNNLGVRLWFHSNARGKSFTKRYKVDRLVYYEEYDSAGDAIAREKEIKAWRREKKNALVQTLNPKWEDLRSQLFLD